jgi:hypothetical protein
VFVTYSVEGVPVRLTDERWNHVCRRHPELNEQEKRVLETIESPEMVLSGDYGEKLAVKFYRTTPLTSKYLVVAYKELSSTDGFVVTAYFSRKVADWREVLWKR